MPTAQIDIPMDEIRAFCAKWKIVELSLFGSVLREDFGDDSDVDVLVVFGPDETWDYFDWPDMMDELSAMFGGRKIDLVERKTVRNPFLREHIMSRRRVVYAA